MLRKLFKYEFKNTYKLMLTIYGVTLIISLLGAVTLSFSSATPTPAAYGIAELLGTAFIILYILTAFALFIITYVYMCVHFYKTMYSSQGYLTHTLPVSPVTTFHVKLLVSLVWMVSSVLILLLSILILLCGASHGDFFAIVATGLSSDTSTGFLGFSRCALFVYLTLVTIFSCLGYLLLVFASTSIGQLFSQNKVAFSIVAGIVIYFIQQIVSTIIVVAVGGSMIFSASANTFSTLAEMMFSPLMLTSFAASAFFLIVFYVICVVIVKKHINLD